MWCILLVAMFPSYSLVDSSQAEASSSLTKHLRSVWKCPDCQESLVVNLAEQLAHSGQCEIQQQQKRKLMVFLKRVCHACVFCY